jgi:TorA maturation chaperone TorD
MGEASVHTAISPAKADFDGIRAGLYALIARLLSGPLDNEFIAHLGQLEGDSSALGQALSELATQAKSKPSDNFSDEYAPLFYGQGQGGEILPFASYYLTGQLYDAPLAAIRDDMLKLGIQPTGSIKEPEDHIAFLLDMMHGLITGRFAAGAVDVPDQQDFYVRHIEPWAREVFSDLKKAESAEFYVVVADLGLAFMEIESEAFKLAA